MIIMEFYSHIQAYMEEIDRKIFDKLNSEDERIYGITAPFLKKSGKRLRPALCLLSCGMAGGKYGSVVDIAAIIEIMHNVTLIHDDIEDKSRFRRGEPTLHTTYGTPTAINCGDALYNFAWNWMLDLSFEPGRIIDLQKRYSKGIKRMVQGQGYEIEWTREDNFSVSEEEYLKMISGKTAALMEISCETGAFFADADDNLIARFGRFGSVLGTAFQIHDDVLNVIGDFSKYKKDIGGDIFEGKRTLMVIHAIANGKENQTRRLKEILTSHSDNDEDIKEAIGILSDCGSIDYARSFSKRLSEEAKEILEPFEDSKDKKSMLQIADYVIERER